MGEDKKQHKHAAFIREVASTAYGDNPSVFYPFVSELVSQEQRHQIYRYPRYKDLTKATQNNIEAVVLAMVSARASIIKEANKAGGMMRAIYVRRSGRLIAEGLIQALTSMPNGRR